MSNEESKPQRDARAALGQSGNLDDNTAPRPCPLLDAALDYASRGWFVIPLHAPEGAGCSCPSVDCESIGKHPRTRKGAKDASRDAVAIRGWWSAWPSANVAVVTGDASELDVLDVDGAEGLAELARLEEEHGPLPPTVAATTGGGGRHVFFQRDRARPFRNRVRFAPGLDARGTGGYVVAAPSSHASGRRYAWEASHAPAEIELAPAPEWLLGLVEGEKVTAPGTQTTDAGTPPPPVDPAAWPDAYVRTAIEGELASMRAASNGERNQTLNTAAFNLGTLEGGGAPLGDAFERLAEAAAGLGLCEREVRKTLASGRDAGRTNPRTAPSPRVAGDPHHNTAAAPKVEDLLREAGLSPLPNDSPLSDVESALRRLANLLANADPVRRAATRDAAVHAVKPAGVSAKTVDAALKATAAAAPAGGSGGAGGSIVFEALEPWPSPVCGAALLDALVEPMARFLVVCPEARDAMALWIVHTYTLDAFEHTPRLAFQSPQKRCGKTRALALLKAAVNRPLLVANVSPAALFRTVEVFCPTLLIDECDTFVAASEELRGILNAGFEPGGSVLRVVGDDHEPRQFSAFAPAALAAIGRLPGTIEDRAIRIEMKRRSKGERIERLRQRWHEEGMRDVRRQAVRWAADNLDGLKGAEPDVPSELDDRAADCWRPLLAIADAAGSAWPERARRAARILSGGRDGAETSVGITLLADLRDIFVRLDTDRISTEAILVDLNELKDRPWPTHSAGLPLTARDLARLLQPFGVAPKTIRDGSGSTPKGYTFEALRDAFERYLTPSTDRHGATAPEGEDLRGNSGATAQRAEPAQTHATVVGGAVADGSG